MKRIWSWVAASRRRTVSVVAALAVVAAAGILVPVALRDGDGVARIDARGCSDARRIGSGFAAATGTGDWKRLAVPASKPCYSLVAARSDASGIDPATTFTLSSTREIDPASVVAIDPPVALTFAKASSKDGAYRYTVTPTGPLTRGTVVRVALRERQDEAPVRTWAFQVQDTMRVVHTLPADRATDVPLDTGIEATLSIDGPQDAASHVRISPDPGGRVEVHKRTLVFVPASLAPRTLYTVTIRKGLGAAGSDERLAADYVFRFETGSTDRAPGSAEPPLRFSRTVWETPEREAPTLGLYTTGSKVPASLNLSVYRLDGAEGFGRALAAYTAIPAWADATRRRYVTPTTGLTKAAAFTVPVRSVGDGGDTFAELPSALPAGFYLVHAATTPAITTFLQVTDLATYAIVSKRRIVVWVNDLAAKAALRGAVVSVPGTALRAGTTEDGSVEFEPPQGLIEVKPSVFGEHAVATGNLVVTNGSRSAIVPLSDELAGMDTYPYREFTFGGDPSIYWRYLYTDRHLYRPKDRIRFWGVVRPREQAASERTLEAVVVASGVEGLQEPVARERVKTTRAGTFIGSIAPPVLGVGYYSLEIRLDGQTISATSFSVEEFVTPAYKIDASVTPRAVFSGTPVRFHVRASFFEGTPVPSLALSYNGARDGSGVTDDDGVLTVPYTPTTSVEGDFESGVLNVAAPHAEESEIAAWADVRVFRSAVGLEAAGVATGGKGVVTGSAYRIDPERLNRDPAADYDAYRAGPATGVAIAGTVVEVATRCTRRGERYDYIAKRVEKYCSESEEVRTDRGRVAATTDRAGRFGISFPAKEDTSYEIRLQGSDSAKRSFVSTVYVYGGGTSFGEPFHLAPAADGPYAVGDDVSVTMKRGSTPAPSGGANRYLWTLAHNGIRSHATTSAPTYSFRFADAHVPDVDVVGVRFDGRTYHEVVSSYRATFKAETRRLTVTVKTDKPRYRPGETAKLAVAVTDAAGKPAKAEVLLSAIDDAVARLQGEAYYEAVDVLAGLYEEVPSGILTAYASHQLPGTYAGGEAGGEGDTRDSFEDTGLFDRVTTGDDGKATATFALPDNITSWRLTAIAVSESLRAGQGSTLIPAGLPLFADASMNATYLASDAPTILVRAFGSALKASDEVRVSVATPTLAAAPVQARAQAFRAVTIALPALQEGTHEVRITVEAAGLRDTLVRKISVVASRLERTTARFDEVAAGGTWKPQPATRRTTVVVTDHNRGRYVPALESLAAGFGDRVDQMLARTVAASMLAEHFHRPGVPAVFVPARYQTDAGGVAIFPYAGADLELSARVADIAPDLFDARRLAAFFQTALSDPAATRERRIVALYGLAALGEPVLLDVRTAAAQRDLTPRERLYVGLAAAAAGDQDTAAGVYEALLADFAQARGAAVRLRVGADNDDVLEATSLAAILGAALGSDVAPALFATSETTGGAERLVDLEQISYLAKALPNTPAGTAEVAYTVAGKRTTTTLADGASVTLDLAPSELAALDLRVVNGVAGVGSATRSPTDAGRVAKDRDVSIVRRYLPQRAAPVVVGANEVVLVQIDVTLSPRAEDGCYQVTDLLPSGMRPVANPYRRGLDENLLASWPYEIDGQRVSFCVYRDSKVKRVAYYARAVASGRYTAEPAVVQSQRAPESFAATAAVPVQVRA